MKSTIAMLTGALIAAVPASAQLDAYSSMRISESPRSEFTLNYSPSDVLRLGYTNVTTETSEPEHVFAAQFTLSGTKFYAFVHEGEETEKSAETDGEAKVHQSVGPLTADLGFGSDGLFHAGIEHGGFQPSGFSICYVGDKKTHETRGQVWNYFDQLGLMTALRAGNRNATVLAGQKNPLFTTRFDHTTDFANDTRYSRILVGHRGSDLYSIDPLDDVRFSLCDPVFKGDAVQPEIAATNPFRYLPPSFAWRVDDWGMRLQRTEKNGSATNEIEGVVYLDDDLWVSANAMRNNGAKTFGARIGTTGKTLDTAIGADYNTETRETTASLQVRMIL